LAFTPAERVLLGIHGLLPAKVETMDQQVLSFHTSTVMS
jgi:hypothetical protein